MRRIFKLQKTAEDLHLQKTIEDFDGRMLASKAWSITFGLVAISGVFATHGSVAFLMAARSAAIFMGAGHSVEAISGIHTLVVTLVALLLGEPGPALAAERPTPATCTYEARTWNVALGRSASPRWVVRSYAALAPEERDPVTGCTVCREDQEILDIPPLAPFAVCHRLAPQVRAVLTALVWHGQPIFRVDGYRAIRSRGPLDGNGNRTVFSNHAYGVALDLNPEQNGLYDRCPRFGPGCRLIRGGAWRPGTPGTLEKDGAIVRAMREAGFHWGGELAGNQKDFMHFSVTGD